MDSFEEWVKTADYPCFQEWGQQVVELGASWDSFRREDKEAIVDDLIRGGIPILAARDMAAIASAEVAKSRAPLAIFWDLENMPIPSETSGRDITSSLKSILAPHGDLIQFRGYASIGLNHIPQEKRSELQLSGCHLVDCPHHGRKEVADKMIIVDAMHFAFQHPEGAALCFITGDVDYAYLLATLQRPQWRTIVISRGTMHSMLHVNCDMKMRWETDILQPIYGNNVTSEMEAPGQQVENKSIPVNAWDTPFRPLSADEGWKDDVELLRTVLKQESQKLGVLAPLKSLIGNVLRATNPARFPQRIAIQSFLARAIEEGIVVEKGEGGLKTLCLPVHAAHPSTVPSLTLSRKLPPSFEGFPQKVADTAASVPYVVMLRTMQCPAGSYAPSKAFVQSSPEWLFYMFYTQAAALDSASVHQWLRQGTFIDVRQITPLPMSNPLDSQAAIARSQMVNCPICGMMVPQNTVILSECGTFFFCSAECKEWIKQDVASTQRAVSLVVETMEFLAGFDDLFAQFNLLGKLLTQRYPTQCTSRRLAKLWVLEAEKSKRIFLYKFGKQKCVALPQYFAQVQSGDVCDKIGTEREEIFVHKLLWEARSALNRKTINQRLGQEFPSMTKPSYRSQVFIIAKAKELFFVAKGAHNQIVGLSQADADAALEASSSIDVASSNAQALPGLSEQCSGSQDPNEGAKGDDSESSDDDIDITALVPRKNCP